MRHEGSLVEGMQVSRFTYINAHTSTHTAIEACMYVYLPVHIHTRIGVGSTRKPMDYSLDKHYSQMKPIEKNFSLIFNPKRDLSSMKWFGDPRMTYLQPVSAKTGEGLNDVRMHIARVQIYNPLLHVHVYVHILLM